MNPIIKNIFAIVLGWLVGSIVNMGLIQAGHTIIPIEGLDPNDMGELAKVMPTLSSKYFIFPFLAHALGTLVGALLSGWIAASHKMGFSLKNSSDREKFFIETARPLTNIADLYFFNSLGEIQVLKNGDESPFALREIKHRKIIFPIELAKTQVTDFYLHLKCDGEVLIVPIKVWTPEAFENQDYKNKNT